MNLKSALFSDFYTIFEKFIKKTLKPNKFNDFSSKVNVLIYYEISSKLEITS